MFLEKSLFLVFLNNFVDKTPSTEWKFIRVQIQGLIMLNFWWNAKIIRNVTQLCNVYSTGNNGSMDNLLGSQD